MHFLSGLIGAAVGGVLAWVSFRSYRSYRRQSPSAAAGFAPKNLSPLMRLWRQQRADAGKDDNWLTRPVVKIDASGLYPPLADPPDDFENRG